MMISSLQQFGKRVVMNRGKILPKILSGMWLCTKSPKVMRFSLRPSAYLCVLCVEIAVKRRERSDTQGLQRMAAQIALFCARRRDVLFIKASRGVNGEVR